MQREVVVDRVIDLILQLDLLLGLWIELEMPLQVIELVQYGFIRLLQIMVN